MLSLTSWTRASPRLSLISPMMMFAPCAAHFLKNPSPKPDAPPVINMVLPATHTGSYGSEVSIGGDCRIAWTRDGPLFESFDIAGRGRGCRGLCLPCQFANDQQKVRAAMAIEIAKNDRNSVRYRHAKRRPAMFQD